MYPSNLGETYCIGSSVTVSVRPVKVTRYFLKGNTAGPPEGNTSGRGKIDPQLGSLNKIGLFGSTSTVEVASKGK